MAENVVYFLLVFDVKNNELRESEQFEDVEIALDRYAVVEQEFLGQGFEVVLVGAESMETVMITHGAYFSKTDTAPRAGLSFSLS